ncbi:MAG: Ig-like domain-containing protein [Clostridiales bacterium]|nr:Ig-like domain-containing protein [Clostridiales bacterium]
MKSIKQRLSVLLLALVLAVSPCSTILPEITTSVQAATVEISETSATLIKGQTLKLKITGTSDTVTWKSSRKSVAKVSASGKVTAKKKGTTTITATVNGEKYKCKITVVTPAISATSLSLTVGNTQKLKISGTTETITWTSSNKKVASVNKNGKITAKKAGTATITATVLGKEYQCVVTVTKTASSDSATSGASSSGSTSTGATSSGSSSSSESSASASSGLTVYITETGSKYHRLGCKYLKDSQIEIDRSAAIAGGYTACSVCNP